ncbi:hypothetical protein pb186bvf_001440 [Paramecium bursaria]
MYQECISYYRTLTRQNFLYQFSILNQKRTFNLVLNKNKNEKIISIDHYQIFLNILNYYIYYFFLSITQSAINAYNQFRKKTLIQYIIIISQIIYFIHPQSSNYFKTFVFLWRK